MITLQAGGTSLLSASVRSTGPRESFREFLSSSFGRNPQQHRSTRVRPS